jgi:NIMA (never in mitosis gene a)-related kinase
VRYIHSQQNVHCDLKPDNIFIMQNGQVKIGDFCSSRYPDQAFNGKMTCIGTPLYVAPELFHQSESGVSCDIWSIGVILYQTMTTKFPYLAKNIQQLIEKISTTAPRPIEENYSDDLKVILQQMLVQNPQDRITA